MGVPGKATDDYQVVLKKRFEARIGNPDWARLNREMRVDEEDLLKVCIISFLICNHLSIEREFSFHLQNLLAYNLFGGLVVLTCLIRKVRLVAISVASPIL